MTILYMLTIVPTPIGNLKDITLRAIEALQSADFIIAENPAHTAKLLQHFDIPKKEMVQFADHNEQRILPKLLDKLVEKHGALVSDAGTPGISDPGFRLVRACWERSIQIDSLPGPSAAITALAASGLPTDKFLFVGFLPKTEPKVIKAITETKNVEATLIAYESPQRIHKTLQTIAKHFPSATVFVGRELTKLHQTYTRNTAANLAATFPSSTKGELTICLSFK
jgi:16S rRNA (cytidine1402-2'-O)-methyltransferase